MPNETSFTKLPAIEGRHGGCLNCGTRPSAFPAGGVIAVGFGCAMLTCDGSTVWAELPDSDEDDMTGAQAEALAAADPDHDWRIVLEAPLSSREYQRHGPDLWVLVRQGAGFA
jgi:hypothetical protein